MNQLIPARSRRPDQDSIFSLNAEATRRRAAGERVVNATLGALMHDDGTLAVLPSVTHTLARVPAAEWAAYAPFAGTGPFVEAVIADTFLGHPALREAAVGVSTPGGTGALRHALTNYLEPGQALLTPSFHWGPYQTLADEHERRVETFNMFDGQGRLDVPALEIRAAQQLAEQGRVLLFLNDPCNNPTGYSLSLPEWRALADALGRLAESGPVTLLVDMAYWLYGAAEDPRAFLGTLTPLLGKVGLLFAWSASKSFTHYGLRVGALLACAPDPADRAATEAAFVYSCRGTWSNCNRGGMWAITQLLTDEGLRRACDDERAGLKLLLRRRVESFNAQAGRLSYPRYEGGFFVTVFHDQAEAKSVRMKEQGVFVVPQKGALRVALCSVNEADLARLVAALED
ncbi:MAG: aminotransferase class I/II-fold pyridoxal phosphate-dependent enzyme [Myxococcota bacterium]|nr:aminotransferase class I/II-fold pyridoxal phosphate-dependent enzyme [Myxococcota bacterium]